MSTIIFGLDGADLELIDEWIDDLPNFRRLKGQGFFGSFKTTEPPITIPAWMCIFSARNPSEFNAYDFRTIDFESYDVELVNSPHFRSKTLIDSLSDTISFRVPGTTPKYPIDGIMVSGFMKGESMEYEPESLREEIEDNLCPELTDLRNYNREETIDVAEGNFKQNFEIYKYLLEEKEFETAFSVFRFVDTAMHNVDKQKNLKEVYRLADEYLGEMIDLVEENGHNLMVLSDHGSMQTHRKLYLNNLLREKGYLRYQGKENSKRRRLEEKVGSFLVNIGLKSQVKDLLSIYSKITGEDPQHTQSTILPSIRKDQTKAFSYISGVSRYGAIWIHDDRFSEGVVNDRGSLMDDLIQDLEKEKFIDEVFIPDGFEENMKMPDLLVKAKKGIVVGGEPYNVNFHETSAVVHDERGLFAGIGPGFKEGKKVNTHYSNIAPTIQALTGQVDIERGEVLDDLLKDSKGYSEDLRGLDL